MQEKEIRICCSGVTRWRRYTKMTVNRLDLSVMAGESILIYGQQDMEPVYRLLMGLEEPDEGELQINGHLAGIPFEFPKMPSFCVWDYMLLPLLSEGKTYACAAAEAEDVLKKTKLWEKKNSKIEFLEPLEKYSLLLYMAISRHPDVLVIGDWSKILTEQDYVDFWKMVEKCAQVKTMAVVVLAEHDRIPCAFEKKYLLKDGDWAVIEGNE